MPKRIGKSQAVPLKLGKDPTLWRFDSLEDAITASTTLLGQLIKEGERVAKKKAVDLPDEEERYSAAGD